MLVSGTSPKVISFPHCRGAEFSEGTEFVPAQLIGMFLCTVIDTDCCLTDLNKDYFSTVTSSVITSSVLTSTVLGVGGNAGAGAGELGGPGGGGGGDERPASLPAALSPHLHLAGSAAFTAAADSSAAAAAAAALMDPTLEQLQVNFTQVALPKVTKRLFFEAWNAVVANSVNCFPAKMHPLKNADASLADGCASCSGQRRFWFGLRRRLHQRCRARAAAALHAGAAARAVGSRPCRSAARRRYVGPQAGATAIGCVGATAATHSGRKRCQSGEFYRLCMKTAIFFQWYVRLVP